MAENLTAESFSGHEGSTFTVRIGDDETIELTLERISEHDRPDLESFSVLFEGPTERRLHHGMYRVEHDEIGTHTLFLGPVATGEEKDDDVQHFEAVFSRRKA